MGRFLLIAIVVGILAASGPARADITAGFQAYAAGDYATATKELKPSAEAGDAMAAFIMGTMHNLGQGTKVDLAEAARWYRLAADKGHRDSQYQLGFAYQQGRGVEKDNVEAVRWYRAAAAQGHAVAATAISKIEEQAKQSSAAREKRPTEPVPQQPRMPPQEQAAKPLEREPVETYKSEMWGRLILPLPTGWKAGSVQRLSDADLGDTAKIFDVQAEERYYFPESEQSDKWTRIIIVRKVRNPKVVTVHHLLARAIQQEAAICDYGVGTEPAVRRQDGVLVAEASYVCSKTKSGKVGFFVTAKLIEEDAHLYFIRRTWRGPPFPGDRIPQVSDRFAEWRAWTSRVKLGEPGAPPKLERVASGSGFAVSEAGHILTNHHVIEKCQEVRLGAAKGNILAKDPKNDLAVVKFERMSAAVKLRGEPDVRAGMAVVAAGYPLAGLLSSDLSITTGVVSALSGPRGDNRMFMITAPVQKGNSGGPLLDMSGNVVGVVTSKLDALKIAQATGDIPQNVNFAMKTSIVRTFLERGNIPFKAQSSRETLQADEVGEKARGYTVLVECWN